MTTLLALVVLAITVGFAPPAALAAERSPARLPELGGVVAAAFAEPVPATAEGCPYHFGSDMPAATFCVYRGVAFGSGGEVCATDVVVIWSSFDGQSPVSVGPTQEASGSHREVYLAFVADPQLVLRAIVDSRQGDRAEMVGYSIGSDDGPQPLAGETTLRSLRRGPSGTADVLSMKLRNPRRFRPGSCAFASYSGTFLGILQPPSEKGTSVDTVIAPRQ